MREIYQEAVKWTLAELTDLVVAAAPSMPRRRARALGAAVLASIEGAYRLASAAPGSVPRGFAAPTVRRMVFAVLDAEEGAADES